MPYPKFVRQMEVIAKFSNTNTAIYFARQGKLSLPKPTAVVDGDIFKHTRRSATVNGGSTEYIVDSNDSGSRSAARSVATAQKC